MAISLPVFYLQHRNRAKTQIHLSFWNFLFRFPTSISTAGFFQFVPMFHTWQSSHSCLTCPDCFCWRPAIQTPQAFALTAPHWWQGRDVTRQLLQGFLQAPVLPCCRRWYTQLPSMDVPPRKEVTSLPPWVCQEAEEDSVVRKGQNLPFEHPFRKTPRSLKSRWRPRNLWSCPGCGELNSGT